MRRLAALFVKVIVNILFALRFDDFKFGRALSAIEDANLAVLFFAVVFKVESALVGDDFIPMFNAEKFAVSVGCLVPVFDDDTDVIDFAVFHISPSFDYFT